MKFLEKIRNAITGIARTNSFSHPGLGRLTLSEDGDWWEIKVDLNGEKVGFMIGGNHEPESQLIQHALDIIADYKSFANLIRSFLTVEVEKFPKDLRNEIFELQIEDIGLLWPDRPNDGMIYFKSPNEFRLWRCDYIARQPMHLGFDD